MNKTIYRLLIIASVGIFIAGLIFLGICIFSENEGNYTLAAALACILLGNLFNLIRIQKYKKQ